MKVISEIPIQRVEDKKKRLNLKQKRRRNLVRKAIELVKMLDMDILMVMKDKDTGRYAQYTSGDKQSGHFDLDQVDGELKRVGKKVKILDDDDYKTLSGLTKNLKAASVDDVEAISSSGEETQVVN